MFTAVPAVGTEAVHPASASDCQRVKPACENIHKTHLPLVRRHKWLPCGLLINRPVYLLEHNKLATNTDKKLENYKLRRDEIFKVLQVFYKQPLLFLCISFDCFLLSHAALLNRWVVVVLGGGHRADPPLENDKEPTLREEQPEIPE